MAENSHGQGQGEGIAFYLLAKRPMMPVLNGIEDIRILSSTRVKAPIFLVMNIL